MSDGFVGRTRQYRSRRALAVAALVAAVLCTTANLSPPQARALTPRVDFGSASTYAVLGGSAITNTGITPLSGSAGTDVGLSPSSAYTAVPGSFPGVAAVNIANADAAQAKVDLQAAYDTVSAMVATPIAGELGGTNLSPGVYTPGVGGVANGAAWTMTTGFTLTGDANSVFIFQTDAAASTAAGMVMKLSGGVQACNVIWRVGAAFSTGAGVDISGRFIAYGAISTGAATVIHGQLLGLDTTPITIGAANSVVNDGCIGDPATTFVESALGTMKYGVPYSDSVKAGTSDTVAFDPNTDVTYSVGSGALPDGLVLNGLTGSITGTPTMPGVFNFSLRAKIRGHTPVSQSFVTEVKPGAQPVVNMGTAASFALLGRTSIVNVGTSTLSGSAGTDVGLSTPGAFASLPGTLQGIGSYNEANATVAAAQADLQAAHVAAATMAPGKPVGAELGGLTLAPGIYENAAAFGFTGTLTLDAGGNPNSVFIIRTPAALVTAAGATVVLANGTQACNVFWVVGGAATLGATAAFSGRILSSAGITLGAGTTVNGQLLTSQMGVVLAGNSVVNDGCAPPGTLSVETKPVALSSVSLNGLTTQAAVATSDPWTVSDARNTGEPWTLTVSATDFVSAAGTVDISERVLSSANLVISPGIITQSAGPDPVDGITPETVTLRNTAQPLLWTLGGNTGTYSFSPGFSLSIPANAFRSNFSGSVNGTAANPYISTVTYTIS
jgi:hypothetical protein